ncbi:MAG TPA: arylamine N-acetyltransferase, partial [Dehalococcoidia bacterium]
MDGEWPSDSTTPSAEWIDRYLRLLGIPHEAPSPAALTRLTQAHLRTVPFENTTALLRRRANLGRPVPPPDPEALLTSWERGRGGGVCFDITMMVGRLLSGLGYRARPVMGTISFAGSHQCVQVALADERFLVDVGNGAPFFDPIPLRGETEVRVGGLAYRFRPGDEPQSWWQDRGLDAGWTPFCRYDIGPPDLAVRESAYQRHHTPGTSWVVDSLTLVRCAPEAVF